jgi:hypothetical protein
VVKSRPLAPRFENLFPSLWAVGHARQFPMIGFVICSALAIILVSVRLVLAVALFLPPRCEIHT